MVNAVPSTYSPIFHRVQVNSRSVIQSSYLGMCLLLLCLLGERVRSSKTYFRNEIASPPLTRRSPGDAGTKTCVAKNADRKTLNNAEQHISGKARVKYPIRDSSLAANIYCKPVSFCLRWNSNKGNAQNKQLWAAQWDHAQGCIAGKHPFVFIFQRTDPAKRRQW